MVQVKRVGKKIDAYSANITTHLERSQKAGPLYYVCSMNAETGIPGFLIGILQKRLPSALQSICLADSGLV